MCALCPRVARLTLALTPRAVPPPLPGAGPSVHLAVIVRFQQSALAADRALHTPAPRAHDQPTTCGRLRCQRVQVQSYIRTSMVQRHVDGASLPLCLCYALGAPSNALEPFRALARLSSLETL